MTNMILTFTENAWEDYLYWQEIDKMISKKINGLIKKLNRHHLKVQVNPNHLNMIYPDIGQDVFSMSIDLYIKLLKTNCGFILVDSIMTKNNYRGRQIITHLT